MPMFRTLVCGIDFSTYSRRALRAAHDLARRFDARVVAVHAIDPLLAEAAATQGGEALEGSALSELRALVEAESSPDANFDLLVRVGSANEQLRAVAREVGADLIVVGTQGLGGVRKLFFGSVTEKVMRESEVPVLAVPCEEPDAPAARFEPDTVVAAIDLEKGSEAVVAYAVKLAVELGASLTLAHVVETNLDAPYTSEPHRAALSPLLRPAEQALEEIALPLMKRLKVTTDVRLGSPAEQIAALTRDHTNALLVMGLGGHGMFRRPGSTAYRVLGVAQAPIITVPVEEH